MVLLLLNVLYFFPGHKNDFLPLITQVSMLKIAEDTNFNLLKGIGKTVESMADKLTSHVTNTSPNDTIIL
jgi:hypothetical protein